MNIKILNKIKKLWTYPPENWERVLYWWKNDLPITFYSWECPPRQIKIDKDYGRFIDFDVDIEAVVSGKKLDQYTEIPRTNARLEDEKWFIKTIVLQNPKTKYLKLIADTNAYYLYPKSIKVLGEKKIAVLSRRFLNALKKFSCQNLDSKWPKFVLFTLVKRKYEDEYEIYFDLIYKSFDNNLSSKYVGQKIIDYWKARMTKHVGLEAKMTKEKADLLKRVISSYAAEGMIFALAQSDKMMPNPVWVNWEEPPLSGNSTEILRKRIGLDSIPKIYLTKMI